MVPPQIVIIPLFLLIVGLLGLSDTYLGIVSPFIINAFGIFLLRQNIKSIPNDYLDAARIEGASEFQILFLVVIPFVKYLDSIICPRVCPKFKIFLIPTSLSSLSI